MNWLGPASVRSVSTNDAADRDLVDFVGQHYPRLIRLAGLVCHDVTDSEDAVQVGLERAWRNRSSLRDQERLASWLDRIVVRESIRLGRRAERSTRWVSIPDAEDTERPGPGPLDSVGTNVGDREAIRAAFRTLPAAQRAVVALHLYQGYSVNETAEMLGVPVETARSRLRLARERLRLALGEVGR